MLQGYHFLPVPLKNQVRKKQCFLKRSWAFTFTFISLLGFGAKAQPSHWNYHKSDSFFKAGAYAEALQENLTAMKFLEKEGSCAEITNANIQVGRIYYFLTDRTEATKWFRKALILAQKCGLDSLQGKCYRNLGSLFFEDAQIDSASFYLEKARELFTPHGNAKDLAQLYATLFEVHFQKNKNGKEAKQYLDSCALYSKLCGDPNQFSFYKIKWGRFCYENGDCQKAIQIYNELEVYYRTNGFKDGLMYTLSSLALAQAKCNLADQGVATMLQRDEVKDSIFKEKTAKELANYEAIFETQKKEIENLELRQRNEKLVGMFTFGSLAAILLAFSGYKWREFRRDKRVAEEKKEAQRQRFLDVIEMQEQERTRIAADLHDGLGHLMAALKLNTSALEVQDESNAKILANAQTIIDQASKEVRQISHQLMPQSLTEIGLVASLSELANRINQSGKMQIQMEGGTEIPLDRKTQVAVYRVVQEVLNNALKHSKATLFTITFWIENQTLFLNLEDNGMGMDLGQETKSKGIGWRNIRSRVELINGTMQVYSSKNKGLKIEIQIPLEAQNQVTKNL